MTMRISKVAGSFQGSQPCHAVKSFSKVANNLSRLRQANGGLPQLLKPMCSGNLIMAFSIFGSKPANAIFLGDQPYAVRNDCQVGQWKVGDDDLRGNRIEISIIKVARYFGNLGKTQNAFWLQLWFVPAPDCKTLPKNTVCDLPQKPQPEPLRAKNYRADGCWRTRAGDFRRLLHKALK